MSDATITETIYVVKDRDGNCRYVGHTRLPLTHQLQKHSEQLRTDYLASAGVGCAARLLV